MYQFLAYINYWLRQVDAHSLHSPFLFEFYNELVAKSSESIKEIEHLREQLIKNNDEIELIDLGAGSRISKSNTRTISSIAKNSASPQKFSVFLKALIAHFNFINVLELGTSLGLNTLYMAQNPDARITTFEGDPSLINLAKGSFKELQAQNINIIEGNIDETLPSYLESSDGIELVYIDANHRYEPTLRYYEMIFPQMSNKGIMVFDDIHWSKEMNQAWKVIQKDKRTNLSIDLFEAGLVFMDSSLPKEDYILKF